MGAHFSKSKASTSSLTSFTVRARVSVNTHTQASVSASEQAGDCEGVNAASADLTSNTPSFIDRLRDACCKNDAGASLQRLVAQSPEEAVALVNQIGAKGETLLVAASRRNRLVAVKTLLACGASVNVTTARHETPLFVAAQYGHHALVELLLKHEADIEARDETGATPLWIACHEGCTNVVKTLLERGAKVDATEGGKHTPLWAASQNGHDDVVRALLPYKPNLEAANTIKVTPLWMAAQEGRTGVVKLLLAAGANVHAASNTCTTPIWIAAHYGRADVIALLLAAGASVHAVDKGGMTPIWAAVSEDHVDAVSALLAGGADIEAAITNGMTPLFIASCRGHIRVVLELLAHEATVDASNADGLTPVGIAAAAGHADVVSALLEHKAPIDAVTVAGGTPLFMASQEGHTDIVSLLLKHGANVSVTDNIGATPLCVASSNGRVEIVRILLEHGSSVNTADHRCLTPLHFASVQDRAVVVAMLLAHGADIGARDRDKHTPLHLASQYGHVAIVTTLLMHEAEVDAPDHDGTTSLHLACQQGKETVAAVLLQHGADINATNATGETPLWLASQRGHTSIVSELLLHCPRVDAANVNGSTPLYIAAQNGHTSIVLRLLAGGADVDAANKRGGTPLHTASARCQLEAVALLLEHGASIDAVDSWGRTSLWVSSQHGQAAVVSVLLQRGASANVIDRTGKTALWIASACGYASVVSELLKHGASKTAADANGVTALHIAATRGHVAVIALLLDPRNEQLPSRSDDASAVASSCECRAVLEAVDAQGTTPLIAAARSGHLDAVTQLLCSGASAHVRTADGETMLVSAARRQDVRMVSALLDLGHLDPVSDIIAVTTSDSSGSDDSNDINRKRESLLAATLQTLREYANQTHEFQTMWMRVIDRLFEIHERLPAAAVAADPSSRELVRQFTMVVFHFARLKATCASRSVIARLVASPTVSTRISDLHTELAFLEQTLDPASTASMPDGWRLQCADDEVALLKQFREQIEGEWRLEQDALRAEDVALLQHTLHSQGSTCSADLLDLLQLQLRKAPAALDLDIHPDVSKWFIPLHDLDVEFVGSGTLHSGAAASVSIARGTWASSVIMASRYTMQREVFVKAVERCRLLSHPNVTKMFGASHLQLPRVAVFENAVSTSLRKYLKSAECKILVWQKLLEASRGLEYLIKSGVVVPSLRCADIWIDTNGVAKICAFSCITWQDDINSTEEVELVRWQAPEIFRGDAPTPASAIYSLAMCAAEALTGKVPFGSMQTASNIFAEVAVGFRPDLPEDVPDAPRSLLERMGRADPSKRPSMDEVIRQLSQFTKSTDHVSRSAPALAQEYGCGPFNLDQFAFDILKGSTLSRFLDRLERMLGQCRESPDAARKIFERMHDVFDTMRAQRRLPSDVAALQFCEVLQSFNQFLGDACRPESVLLRTKSQKASLQSGVLHRQLDSVLKQLGVATNNNPIHVWQQADPSAHEAQQGGDCAATDSSAQGEINIATLVCDSDPVDNQAQAPELPPAAPQVLVGGKIHPVMIVRFENNQLNNEFKELDMDAIEAGTTAAATGNDQHASRPQWLIMLHEISIDTSTGLIGKGSFGNVYMAKWGSTPVVVKYMGFEADGDSQSTELFFHELRVWFPLSHPHVLKLHGACHLGKRYFVCEYASNGTLRSFLEKNGGNASRRWQLLHQVALGLKHMHDHNILHNDLKCDNVLISAGGDAKIIDFGLSSILNSAEIQVDPRRQGAAHWRSPEYLIGKDRITLASDIYAFGMLILEAVTGSSPWGRALDLAVKTKVKNGTLPPRPKTMSTVQWRLVEMMCVKEPMERVAIAHVVTKLYEFSQQEQLDSSAKNMADSTAAAAVAS